MVSVNDLGGPIDQMVYRGRESPLRGLRCPNRLQENPTALPPTGSNASYVDNMLLRRVGSARSRRREGIQTP
jgi:hypothetical protein